MSRLRFCLLLAVICSCSQYGLAYLTTPETIIIPVDQQEPEKVSEAVIPETTIAPPAPEISTSKPKPTTTTTTTPASTTTTTPASTTTTTPASTTTTTPASTTTTTPATTTTPKPTPAPTPAPAPGPPPPPEQGTWVVTDPKTNVTCIVAQFAAQLNVTYTKLVNNATSLWSVIINVPANAKVVGNCSAAEQWMQVSWLSSNTSTLANNMTLVYHRNETTKDYGLKTLNVSLSPEIFVNSSSKDPMELYHGAEWLTPLATSYRCKTATLLNMTSESASAVAVLTLSRLQEEAYRTTNGTGFSAARECGGSDVPDAVPIAVGCALGGLVLVVLVAYLVGRRRSAARGYLSM